MATSIRAIQRLPDTDATLPAESARENTAEGYTVSPTSVTVGNSGGGSGDAFSLIVGAVTAVNTDSKTGSWSYEFPATTGTAASVTLNVDASRWVAIRLYAKLTGYPSAIMEWIRCNTAGISFSINLQTSGIPMLSVTPFTTLGVALTLNVWQRHELIVDMGGAPGQGTMYYRVYNADDSTVLGTIPQTYGLPLGSNPVISVRPGKASTSGNLALFRIDGFKAITARTTEIGPDVVTVTASGAGSAASDATGASITDRPASGAGSAATAATGQSTAELFAAGTGSASSSATAASVTVRDATGSADATSDATAASVTVKPAEGSGSAESTATAAAIVERPSSGAGSATTTATGAATVSSPANHAGAGSATSNATADSFTERPASGTASATSSVTVDAVTERPASGEGSADSNADGLAYVIRPAAGTGEADTEAVALSYVIRDAEGAGSATSDATGISIVGLPRIITFTGHIGQRIVAGRAQHRDITGRTHSRNITGEVVG